MPWQLPAPMTSSSVDRPLAFYAADTYRVQESVGFLLSQVRSSMKRQIDAEMARHGLTDAQWAPLYLISLGSDCTSAELAQRLGIDAGAMTRTLDRLEAKGLLVRARSTADRRQVHLALTDVGRAAVAHVPAVLAQANNAHLDGFSAEEFGTLRALLERMLDNGRRIADQPRGATTAARRAA